MCEVPLYLQPPATPTHTHGPQWHSFHRFEKFRVCHEGGGGTGGRPLTDSAPNPPTKNAEATKTRHCKARGQAASRQATTPPRPPPPSSPRVTPPPSYPPTLRLETPPPRRRKSSRWMLGMRRMSFDLGGWGGWGRGGGKGGVRWCGCGQGG
jgi:hypothetical protein